MTPRNAKMPPNSRLVRDLFFGRSAAAQVAGLATWSLLALRQANAATRQIGLVVF